MSSNAGSNSDRQNRVKRFINNNNVKLMILWVCNHPSIHSPTCFSSLGLEFDNTTVFKMWQRWTGRNKNKLISGVEKEQRELGRKRERESKEGTD